MLHTIQNSAMSVTVDELGAQLMRITAADGTEYLWSGDPAYWRNRAPNLFPYVGRLTGDRYTLDGQSYEMTRHGFANRLTFAVEEKTADRVTLSAADSPERMAITGPSRYSPNTIRPPHRGKKAAVIRP